MVEGASYLLLALQLGAAAALVMAGSAKLAERSAIRTVIIALRVPWASAVAFVLAVSELGTGLALVLLPGTWVTSGLVIALALTFASAAALGLRGRLEIECACFGSTLRAPLGWRQLILVPVWTVVAVSVVAVPVVLPDQRLPVAFAVISAIGTTRLFKLVPLLTEHRTQRRIIEGAA
jgi:hypothetical protein